MIIRKRLLTLAALAGSMFIGQSGIAQEHSRCSTNEYLAMKYEQHPELVQQRAEALESMESILNEKKFRTNEQGNVVIPVVFHIVYRTNGQNLPDSRITSQMKTLNDDYNMLNEDISEVPTEFQDVVGNIGIEFCLAKTDPNGNPTNGVIRYETDVDGFSINSDNIKHASQGGADAWDTSRYLNIWVGEISAGLLGYATPPGAAGPGEDGVVIGWRNVGVTNSSQYNRGRTATHEVGHYFNLEHIWGDGPCSASDGVDDTPSQQDSYYGKPTYPKSTCGSSDMFMNFMDYVDDEAMFMFTKGQKERMLAALNGPRASLLNNNLTLCSFPLSIDEATTVSQLNLYPNPANDILHIRYEATSTDAVTFYMTDMLGKKVFVENLNELTGAYEREINLSHLPKGVYQFVVTTKNGVKAERVVLQ